MKQHVQYHLKKYIVLSLLLSMCLLIAGCEAVGMVAYAIGGEQKENVQAQYRGLENSRFAVLVAADENTLYQSPEAPHAICTALTRELATRVPGAIAVPPKQMIEYQNQNPYWTTSPYDKILAKLDVDELVIVDIVQYQIHDKGNASVWRGTAVATARWGCLPAATQKRKRCGPRPTARTIRAGSTGRVRRKSATFSNGSTRCRNSTA